MLDTNMYRIRGWLNVISPNLSSLIVIYPNPASTVPATTSPRRWLQTLFVKVPSLSCGINSMLENKRNKNLFDNVNVIAEKL